MRMQLAALAFLALVASAGEALAQGAGTQEEAWSGEVVSRYLLYADDDATTVSTGVVDAKLQLPQEVQMGAHFLLDAVSSASVDVVSAATERWTETRGELGIRASRPVAGSEFGLGYVRSMEEDWTSDTLQLGIGRDFFQRNFRVESKVGVVQNQIGRASDPVFEEEMQALFADLGVSQLLDPKSRVGLSYGLQSADGYQSSVYRYVQARDGTRKPETHPENRLRQSISGYALRELHPLLTARLQYRFYFDDWGIRSHTAELRLRVDLSDSFFIGWHARGYQQSDADFYRKEYLQNQKYMSADRELSRFWNVGSGVNAGTFLGPVLVDAKIAVTHYSFKNFAALPTRLATMVGAGASVPW